MTEDAHSKGNILTQTLLILVQHLKQESTILYLQAGAGIQVSLFHKYAHILKKKT